MSDIQDYDSSLSNPESRKFETFSYLPPMDAVAIRKQAEWIVQNGWNPAIEHSEPENATSNFWYMWKLPMFGETDIDKILAEAEACHKAHPGNHVKLIGFDNYKQSKGTEMIIYRAQAV